MENPLLAVHSVIDWGQYTCTCTCSVFMLWVMYLVQIFVLLWLSAKWYIGSHCYWLPFMKLIHIYKTFNFLGWCIVWQFNALTVLLKQKTDGTTWWMEKLILNSTSIPFGFDLPWPMDPVITIVHVLYVEVILPVVNVTVF